jgi:ribose-phosphate pyrophosphokinase
MDSILFTGSANRPLGERLSQELGVRLGQCALERFPDGEVHVEVQEEVRERNVWLLQSTEAPVGENLLELLLLADACWRAGARRMTAVVPYFGYARQDRRTRPGEALGGRLLAELVSRARFERLVAVDLHNPALEGCFGMPLEHVSAVPALVEALRPYAQGAVVVSPDLGAVKRAETYARLLGVPMAVVHKSRQSGAEVSVQGLVGEVKGLRPIVVDDLISTGGTVAAAAAALVAAGCEPEVTVAATHALMVGPAVERLKAVPVVRLISTDSVMPPQGLPFEHQVVSLAPLLAEALRRLAQ